MATQIKHRRGNSTELSTFTPAIGELVMNTDTNELIIGDGITVGGHVVGGGVLNVKLFGAKGDGVTDDTAAIQNAINFISAGEIYIPAGTYLISSMLNVQGRKTIRGSGSGATILKSNGSTAAMLRMSGIGSQAYRSFQRLIGLSLDGVDRNGYGLWTYSNADFLIEDVRIDRCTWGVWNDGSLIGTYERTRINACDTGLILGNNSGGAGDLVTPTNLVSFRNCDITACKRGISYLDESPTSPAANQVLFEMCEIENNCIDENSTPIPTEYAVAMNASDGIGFEPTLTFRNCWFESNKGAADIYFVNSTDDNRSLIITECAFIGNSGDSVYVLNSGGGNMRFVMGSCGLTSVPTSGDSVRVEGANVYGGLYNTIANSVNNTSTGNWKEEDTNGRAYYLQEFRGNGNGVSFRGGGGTFDATMSMTGNQLIVDSEDSIRINTGGTDKYLWHFDNLIRMGSFYLWFDSSGQLRRDNTVPTNKDTDGTIIG